MVVRQAPRLVRRMARTPIWTWARPAPATRDRPALPRTRPTPGHATAPVARHRTTPVAPGRSRTHGTVDIRPPASAPIPSRERARRLVYCPHLDGPADTGEIVWAWIPDPTDPAGGRDRPVLLIGRSGTTLLGLSLSDDPVYELDPAWIALGAGPWSHGRFTWVRLDLVADIPEAGIRREGAILPRPAFDLVAYRLCAEYQWF